MRVIITYLLSTLFLVTSGFAQTDSTELSTSFIPKEIKGELLYVEKYSQLSPSESIYVANVERGKATRDECIENIYFYNLVFRRKINAEIAKVFDKHNKLDNIQVASTRDINENIENNIRFVLKAEYSAKDLVKDIVYSPEYYIYDQLEDIRYASFWSLDATLETLESFKWYSNNRIADDTQQATVDDYVSKRIPDKPKPKRQRVSRMPRSSKILLGGVLTLGVLAIINAIFE